MGNRWVTAVKDGPDLTPAQDSAPTFDPLFGFPNGRKARVMSATQEEMEAVQLQKDHRNYCAKENVAVSSSIGYFYTLLYLQEIYSRPSSATWRRSRSGGSVTMSNTRPNIARWRITN